VYAFIYAIFDNFKINKELDLMTAIAETTETISICGLMVHVLPEKIPEVKPRILAIAGSEIHGIGERGNLVVTIESDHYKTTADRITELQKLQGVLSAAMIYQHTEKLEEETLEF
jgi:nitrate reductase NapD